MSEAFWRHVKNCEFLSVYIILLSIFIGRARYFLGFPGGTQLPGGYNDKVSDLKEGENGTAQNEAEGAPYVTQQGQYTVRL